ncbi:MAG: hypothetical protein ACTSQW_07610 [Promethearchaeota archaeon]
MKKYKKILIVVVCSLIPLLFTSTIPFAAHTRLDPNSIRSNEHGWTGEQLLYVISLESGSDYTIIVFSGSWSMDVSIKVGETPYMINGLSVDSSSTHEERMHFTSKSEENYIQIKVNSGSGFFYIEVESGTTGSATGSTTEFFDVSYLLVLAIPSIFILAVGLFILKKIAARPERKPSINIYRKKEKEDQDMLEINEDVMICESCGVEIKKKLKKCPNCRTTLK